MPREESDLVQLKLRFREALRAKLETAAGKSGRSLNSEIVDRLEESLSREQSFADPRSARALQLLVSAMQTAEMRKMRNVGDKPTSWLDDPATGAAVVAACTRILAAFAPGSGKTDEEKKLARWGRDLAGMMVDNLERAKADRLGTDDGKA